jgi:hypothetical protein
MVVGVDGKEPLLCGPETHRIELVERIRSKSSSGLYKV